MQRTFAPYCSTAFLPSSNAASSRMSTRHTPLAPSLEKEHMTYTSQGMAYSAQPSTVLPASNSMSTPYSSVQGTANPGALAENPSIYDNTAKGKAARLYNKIENQMRKKWDSSSGPSFSSDPLGGYTVKGPGYYEKKHKFTRRITRRGNPPPVQQVRNGMRYETTVIGQSSSTYAPPTSSQYTSTHTTDYSTAPSLHPTM